jgi:hypothetical protein
MKEMTKKSARSAAKTKSGKSAKFNQADQDGIDDDATAAGDSGGEGEEAEYDEDYWNEDEEPLLYFKTPQQLLDIFAELEENNLALIQNCQETEETLEELKQKILETEARM